MTFAVYLQALKEAVDDWAEAEQRLRTAGYSLDDADVSALGRPRLADAARAFVDTWTGELGGLRQQAGDNAAALDGSRALYGAVEGAELDRIQRLLAFEDRNAAPDLAIDTGSGSW